MTNSWSPADNPHKGSRAIRAERELEHSPASAWVRAIVCPFFAPRSLAAKMEISRLARGSSLTSRGPTWARRARARARKTGGGAYARVQRVARFQR
jgi:hypothetical protein